jgi:hypothetical protein
MNAPGACFAAWWPAALPRFTFGSNYSNQHVMDYPMFEEWLLIHQYTLTSVDIGYLPAAAAAVYSTPRCFQTSKILRLSRWQMHGPVQFTPEDANVLGLSLTRFAWDFTVYDQHTEAWSDFGEPEANWVKKLAKAAVSRKAVLKEIHIQFAPDGCYDTTEEMGYPWD